MFALLLCDVGPTADQIGTSDGLDVCFLPVKSFLDKSHVPVVGIVAGVKASLLKDLLRLVAHGKRG